MHKKIIFELGSKLNVTKRDILLLNNNYKKEKLLYPGLSFIYFICYTVLNFVSSKDVLRMDMNNTYPYATGLGLGASALMAKSRNSFIVALLLAIILIIGAIWLKILGICPLYGAFRKDC